MLVLGLVPRPPAVRPVRVSSRPRRRASDGRPAIRRGLAAAAILLGLVLAAPRAEAHAVPAAMDPAPDARLDAPPRGGGDPVHRAGRAARQLARRAGREGRPREPGGWCRRPRGSLALPGCPRAAPSRRLHGVLAGPVRRRRPRHQRRPRFHGRDRRPRGAIRSHGPERRRVETARPVAGRAGRRAAPGRPRWQPGARS